MNQLPDIQQALFREIQSRFPDNVSCVHELSELLFMSYDSVYRRMRGEKTISLEELYTLCKRYSISVDSLFDVRSGKVIFDGLAIEPSKMNLAEWLAKIQADIQHIAEQPDKLIIYAAKDVPFYHFFQIPEIAAFKIFFWQKTLFDFGNLQDRQFSFNDFDESMIDIGRKVLLSSVKIPTIEIWNEDTFNIFLRQIEYYWVSGIFKQRDDVELLCDKLAEWIRQLENQAKFGYKFLYGQQAHGIPNTFSLYENEVVLNDNSLLAILGDKKVTYLTYNVISLLVTRDVAFCERIHEYLKGLISKSTLISASAAKERSRFFNKMAQQVKLFRQRIRVAPL